MSFLIWLLVLAPISFLFIWILYVMIMCIKHHHLNDLTPVTKPIVITLGFIGYGLDMLWNIIYGTLIFWQLPPRINWDAPSWNDICDDLTLTHRLRVILRHESEIQNNSWRYRLAQFICSNFLNPFDEGHCG